jgi:RimJ/RimL family protein N-acetyltransferase
MAPFDLQPVLQGTLLDLRPLRIQDFNDLYAVARDPLIWEQHPAKNRGEADQFRIFFQESLDSGGALIATEKTEGRIIGSSRYFGYSETGSEIEIGWTFLARSYWGGRYNGEMKRLMLEHAFRFVERVVFLIGPMNYRSQRAVEKIGAIRLPTTRNNNGRESLVYQITAAAFRSFPAPGAGPAAS